MSKLISIIVSQDQEVRNQSFEVVCNSMTLEELLQEAEALETYRKSTDNLYFKVRALFFLYALHRFCIPFQKNISRTSLISFQAYRYLLKRRFEETIEILLNIQAKHGANEGISSGLSEAYHKLGFQTLADQVKKSVRSVAGNQWMFRIGHPDDHPLSFHPILSKKDPSHGLFPILKEETPVRMDITHSGWSDIFFLGMDFPQGAKVMNISVDLSIFNDATPEEPQPPIETYFRIIEEPLIRLTSIDLNMSADITELSEIFDFAKDHLGLLKAAIISSGIIPPGMEGSEIPLSRLLEKLTGTKNGFELVSKVNNIPKGSRLAVSTNLLASLISLCMRATNQTQNIANSLNEDERRWVAARAILGEWIGGSGGGWQDSGGVWPGIKLICGVEAAETDPEFNISKGCLLPQHTLLNEGTVDANIRRKLNDSLVIVHGGMAQDVGPILEMVTEKYLLRSQKEWHARHKAIDYFDEVVEKLKLGDIKGIAEFTQKNFDGPIQDIIPWANTHYTEKIIASVKNEFKDDFWGFWMMGGMSGGGMGFMFHPKTKKKAQARLKQIMSELKNELETSMPFGMTPVVYDFKINERGTFGTLLHAEQAIMPFQYYTLLTPGMLRKEIKNLTNSQRSELAFLSGAYKSMPTYKNVMNIVVESMLPQAENLNSSSHSLEQMRNNLGFDYDLHQQIRADLLSGRIGLAQNRLPINAKIEDVSPLEILKSNTKTSECYNVGLQALKNDELAILTLAGGVGSRWTKGSGVVKSLNPFTKMEGQYRNFIEIHLAKNNKIKTITDKIIPHVFSTSYLTHSAIQTSLKNNSNYHYQGDIFLSKGQIVGQKLIPTERDLRFLWEELPQQELDVQAEKMRQSIRKALINWAKETGEGEDYTMNNPEQCLHPVGHWFEIPNMLLNGTLAELLKKHPKTKYLLLHNIDTLGVNADPALLGTHILSGNGMTCEVITRKMDDRGGGLAKIDGRIRLIEGLALPNEEIEFQLSYYNTNTCWITIANLLETFQLSTDDLSDYNKVHKAILEISRRMPSYITIKDVKKRWGKGQEDIFPVAQYEKIWGDMTTLSELKCDYLCVDRMRGQQLKEVSQLDGWLRDGSAQYVNQLCKWENNN